MTPLQPTDVARLSSRALPGKISVFATSVLAIALSLALSLAQTTQAQQRRGGGGTTTLDQFVEIQGQPESARIPIVRGLAQNNDPAVTEAIRAELTDARTQPYRQALLQALGAVQREGALQPLAEVLRAGASSPIERSQAARGLAQQGEDGLRELARIARRSEHAQARTYATIGLSSARSALGWELLADLIDHHDSTMRGQVIRYLRNAPAIDPVTTARVHAAKDSDAATAASAVRQLIDQEHDRAGELLLDVCERSQSLRGTAAVDLLYAVSTHLNPDLHAVAIRLAGQVRGSGRIGTRALKELLPRLSANDAFVTYVRDELEGFDQVGQVRIGLELIAALPGEQVSAEIAEFAGGTEISVVSTALDILAKRGDRSVLPDLEKLLRGRDVGRRIEVLSTMHTLRRAEPQWETELLAMLEKSSRRRKAAVEFGHHLSLLADLGCEEALAIAWEGLEHRDWTVRAAAIDFCREVRTKDSVPQLIARLDEESGRLRDDLLSTLKSLTAMRFNARSNWDRWWSENESGFALIPADAFAKEEGMPSRGSGQTVSSYYGIPLVSDRVVFVMDVSSSMSARFGTDANHTRLEEAKRQLKRVLRSTPEHFLFNVVSFGTAISPMFDEMQRIGGRRRDEARENVDQLRPVGATNMHDALERAFEERELDTIYLLSDGAPSAGPITDPEQLAATIRRWNQTRRIRIHCISIGSDSPLLRRIAEESGGEYASSR
ncbi:MAG: VWA domain-containing protein [Planctomycetota bacterium]